GVYPRNEQHHRGCAPGARHRDEPGAGCRACARVLCDGRRAPGARMIREERLVPVGSVFEGEPEAVLAVTVTAPEAARLTDPPLAFFCAPGGGLDRGYFDLRAGVGTRFSFAVQMADRGCITIAIDPLGIGGSTRPARGF